MTPVESGILVIDKPQDMTSHDVVAIARRALHTKRVGHAGTLDPMATGVLALCVGRATKLVPYLQACPKTYRCTLTLGAATDTQDQWGNVVERSDPSHITEDQVRRVFGQFVGNIWQMPPMYSALKVKGQKLVDLARAGQTVERAPRQRHIYRLDILEIALPKVLFEVACEKGTYIRTLCHDMGEALGSHGHLEALERLESGSFRLEEASSIEALKARGAALLLPPERAVAWMPRVVLPNTEGIEKAILNGVKIDLSPYVASDPQISDQSDGSYAVYMGSVLWGIGERTAQGIFMKKRLKVD